MPRSFLFDLDVIRQFAFADLHQCSVERELFCVVGRRSTAQRHDFVVNHNVKIAKASPGATADCPLHARSDDIVQKPLSRGNF